MQWPSRDAATAIRCAWGSVGSRSPLRDLACRPSLEREQLRVSDAYTRYMTPEMGGIHGTLSPRIHVAILDHCHCVVVTACHLMDLESLQTRNQQGRESISLMTVSQSTMAEREHDDDVASVSVVRTIGSGRRRECWHDVRSSTPCVQLLGRRQAHGMARATRNLAYSLTQERLDNLSRVHTHAARCEQLELQASVKQHGLQYLGHQLVRVIAMTQTTIDSLAPGVDITVVFALLHHGRVASERDRQSIGVVLLGGIELLRVDELLLQYSSRMDELEAANDD